MSAASPTDTTPQDSLSKRFLIAVLPTWAAEAAKIVKRIYLLVANYAYDFWRYTKYSSAVFRGDTEEKMRALITIHYHSIEKGLSLPNPRPGFGKHALKELLDHMQRYLDAYGPAEHLSIPINALMSYIAYNNAKGINNDVLLAEVNKFTAAYQQKLHRLPPGGGAIKITKQEINLATATVGSDFFFKRYSIRQFSKQDVALSLLEEAVRRAQKTPAVCNRQSGKAWIVTGKESVAKSLAIQKGANGFSDCVNKVIIITSDQCNFQSAGERYQSWIDGGLFAMSMIYALHSLGLGSCCLNWSMEHAKDRELKREFHIPQSETIIMLLAVGHIPDELMVAESVRKPIEEVMHIIQ